MTTWNARTSRAFFLVDEAFVIQPFAYAVVAPSVRFLDAYELLSWPSMVARGGVTKGPRPIVRAIDCAPSRTVASRMLATVGPSRDDYQ